MMPMAGKPETHDEIIVSLVTKKTPFIKTV